MLQALLLLLPVLLAGALGYYLGSGKLASQPANKEAKTIYADANLKTHADGSEEEANDSLNAAGNTANNSALATSALASSALTSSSASSSTSTASFSSSSSSSLNDETRSSLRQRIGFSRRASGGTHWPPSDSEHELTDHDDIIPAADADEFDEDEEEKERVLDHMKKEHEKHVSLFQHEGLEGTKPKGTESTPLPFPDRRRVFIISKSLPISVHVITGTTPVQLSPQPSPIVAPLNSNGNNDIALENAVKELAADSFTLDAATDEATAATTTSPTNPVAAPASSPCKSGCSPCSSFFAPPSVAEVGKYRMKWDDQRSWLSNLRCLTSKDGNMNSSTSEDDKATELTWIGLSPIEQSFNYNAEEKKEYEDALRTQSCVPVYLNPELANIYVNSFCKQVMWPLLHYMTPTIANQSIGKRWEEMWSAYQAANQAYADVILAQMKNPTDVIWIHNFYLFALPGLIRQRRPRATIGLFIHTPFPSSDVFRALPSRKEILQSMMDADLLGFHTFDYARHFLSCIKRVLDLDFETLPGGVLGIKYNGRFVSILISHVGIQSKVLRELADSDTVRQRVEKLRSRYPGRKILVGVDEIDMVKGPLLKLQAIDRFFVNYPQYKDKVVILEMLIPSKNMDNDGMKTIHDNLIHMIHDIQKKHGKDVIQVLEPATNQGVNLLELVTLYNAAEVALVSTFWDGLNLAPFEFTASQNSSTPGALIISEFMGCSRALNGVIRVNPWSLEIVSEAIHTALEMSLEERQANHARRFNYVMHHTVESWANGFLDNLMRATKLGAELNYVAVGTGRETRLMGLRQNFVHLSSQKLTTMYQQSELRVILTDLDGTLLTPSKSSRNTPPPPGVIKLLKFLSEDPRNVVFVMSGRPRSILTEWFGDLKQLGLAAEKGLFLRWPARLSNSCRFDKRSDLSGDMTPHTPTTPSLVSPDPPAVDDQEWEYMVPLEDLSWKQIALEIIGSYTEQTDGSWIEDKEYAIVWHYDNCDVEYGRMQAADLQKYLVKVLANPNVDVLRYDKSRVLEVKPHGVNKGLAATAILESLWMKHHRDEEKVPNNGANNQTNAASSPSSSPNGANATKSNPLSPRTAASAFHPLVLCIGDDRSDEDMFVAVQQKLYLDGKVRGRGFLPTVHGRLAALTQSTRTLLNMSTVPISVQSNSSFSVHESEQSNTTTHPSNTTGSLLSPHGSPSSDPFLFTVCVGMKPSNASYFLNNEEEVVRVLYGLVLATEEEKTKRRQSGNSQTFTSASFKRRTPSAGYGSATSPLTAAASASNSANQTSTSPSPTSRSVITTNSGPLPTATTPSSAAQSTNAAFFPSSVPSSSINSGMGAKKNSFGVLTALLFGDKEKKEE